MAEYVVGFEFVREPDQWLEAGAVVQTHTHNFHHNTHLVSGLWEVHRFQPVVLGDGTQAQDANGNPLWHALPVLTVKGGGPRSIVPIPAHMSHKFVLLEGPGFYRCVFAHRDADGIMIEHTEHYTSAYV